MRLFSFLLLSLLSAPSVTAFVTSNGPKGSRRLSPLAAAAPKKAATKKAAPKAASKVVKEVVITKRKNDLVASVVESTGLTKAECESCVNAMLETIVQVCDYL